MKNINLTPTSSDSDQVVRGNKPFILISLVVLMFLCFVYFLRLTPFGKQWVSPYENKIVTSISSLIVGRTKPAEREKVAFIKEPSGTEESVDHQSIRQKETGKKERVELEKKDSTVEKAEERDLDTPLKIESAMKTLERADRKKIVSVGIKGEEVREEGNTKKVASVSMPSQSVSPKGVKGPPESAGDHYLIQVCSCVLKNNAEMAFRRLDYLGFSPIMKETIGRTKMHNIYTDHLQRGEANRLMDQIKGQGFEPVLLSDSDGKYRLRIASCLYKESAQKILKKLTRLGYQVNIHKETTATKMYSVLLGQYRNMDEAENTRLELKSNGFQSPILKRMPRT